MEDIFSSWLVNGYIAHRGLHNSEFPENSLGAFKNAVEKGYACELDVRLIGDGTVVVLHDSTLGRMTGRDKYVNNITKEDLKTSKLLDTEYTIPTLEEVLKTVDGKVPLLIEIKQDDKVGELESKIYNLLKDYKGEYAVESFNPFSLSWFKINAPHIWRGQLSSFFKQDKLALIKKILLKKLKMNKISDPHFISYDAECLPNKWVKKCEKLPILAWTVRSQQQYLDVIKHSDNIIFENFLPKI